MGRQYYVRNPYAQLLSRETLRGTIMNWCLASGLFPGESGWQRGMTARFAEASGLSRGMIGQLLSGARRTCTPVFAVQLARTAAVPVDSLFLIVMPSHRRQAAVR